ncbi:putative O-glycosylation ligase, exosortase A system-associated [Thiohalobacter sp. IOR34]|uniref:putative O-glycosylation ligase, exosortase A system-associated n=1 Tax=Thiohalobacter sp. IOR34 TaxID=3057176 RepID=UPI0025AFC563|nr:putative O-glycosylation ligase, exosortase A system-associated [Thiohalobacter sp. IOR34]WJW74451.1 putative O-glycosylation ligase, exosortase A system-associated [Thiohalobacter sp. IOR34]
MRDIVVLLFLVGAIGAAFWRPWLGVLALAVFSYMNPHSYSWSFMRSFPVYQTLFLAFLLAFLINGKDRQPLPRDWRIPTFFALWLYFLITTLNAILPALAWQKLIEVSKIYLPFIFTLWLINTRKKLYYLIITIASSFGILAVKGGIWAIGSGFSFRVYGPPGTQFYENNAFAIATLMNIPLLILWLRETGNSKLKYALMAAIPLCFAAALSSFSRGALLTMAVLVPLLLWHSKRKYLALPVLLIGALYAVNHLPEHWFERMQTLESYQEDKSAQGRLEAWTDGINYALRHPFTGAGFEGWRWVTRRDWHSSYVEILAEHGFIAFGLWLSLLFGSIISLTRLPRKVRHIPELGWVSNYAYMLRASLIAYATGTLFLGLSYWDIFYHLVFIAVLVRKFALEELAAHQETRSREAPIAEANPTQGEPPRLETPQVLLDGEPAHPFNRPPS